VGSVSYSVVVFASGPFGRYYHYLGQVLAIVDFRILSFSMCCNFKSLLDNFVWGLMGVYGLNDDIVRSALWSNWDVPWCLGGDFNVVRFPSERSTRGRLTSAMTESSDFIDSCNLIDHLLEGSRFTCSGNEEVPVLSRVVPN